MKVSSFFFLGVVVIVFVAIQGWVLVRTFVAPEVFTAREATLQGSIVDVRTPREGTVRAVLVQEDERVEQGKELFLMARTVRDAVTQEEYEEEFVVTAIRPGVVTDIQVVEGAFAQSDQKVAQIIDGSENVLHVRAQLSVAPADVAKIRPLAPADVSASFVNGGKPMRAVISSVDPLYDAATETIGVRLRFLEPPAELQTMALGVPVDARVVLERDPPGNPILAFFAQIFPPVSEARQ